MLAYHDSFVQLLRSPYFFIYLLAERFIDINFGMVQCLLTPNPKSCVDIPVFGLILVSLDSIPVVSDKLINAFVLIIQEPMFQNVKVVFELSFCVSILLFQRGFLNFYNCLIHLGDPLINDVPHVEVYLRFLLLLVASLLPECFYQLILPLLGVDIFL